MMFCDRKMIERVKAFWYDSFTGERLKIRFSHLYAPLCGSFGSNCDMHLAESNLQTHSVRKMNHLTGNKF
jgi:hypothetical protein